MYQKEKYLLAGTCAMACFGFAHCWLLLLSLLTTNFAVAAPAALSMIFAGFFLRMAKKANKEFLAHKASTLPITLDAGSIKG